MPTGSAYWAEDVADKHDNEIPTWDCMGTYVHTQRGEVTKDLLDTVQIGELQLLLEDYPAVVSEG